MTTTQLLASGVLALLTTLLAAGGAALLAHHHGYQRGYQRGWRARQAYQQTARTRYVRAASAGTAPRPLSAAQRDHQSAPPPSLRPQAALKRRRHDAMRLVRP